MVCPVARRLLKSYHHASLAFREAADVVMSGIPPMDSRFEAARSVMSSASEALHVAQREYWNHVRDHRCRKQFSGAEQRQTDEQLRRDMLQARQIFDKAVEQHDCLMTLREDLSVTSD